MNRLLTLLAILFLVSFFNVQAQEIFTRSSTIHTLTYEPGGGGFGGFVAGVDLDEDGIPEIYACNANYIDRDGEMVPKIWKFEWNETTAAWDSVWGATLPGQGQNTWVGFTIADLDKDGKPEIVWCPPNFPDAPGLINPNPLRVIVYEVVGDGSDNLGVDDGFGAFLPNASTTIVTDDNYNLRPISLKVVDIDSDGRDELIFADQTTNWHFGVLSVDDIPDNGSGLETWTVEASGVTDPILVGTGNKWDLAVVGKVIYLFAQSGIVYPVKYDNGTWTSLPGQSGVGNGSFKGTAVADLDNDGIDEIVEGSWFTGGKVYVLKQVADTLQSFEVADLSLLGATRLNGAAVGDLDNDGRPDFVFGSRGDGSAPSVPNNSVYRVEFQGGDITLPANYISSVIDSFLVPEPDGAGGQLDVFAIGNMDGDAPDEVIYTQGYTRGIANDTTADAAILDIVHTPVSVELETDVVPAQFYLDQNYPNPFNPSTQIKFGITEAANVDLRIYDVLGSEVAVLINNQYLGAGSYNAKFNAVNLASGIYVYRLTAGTNSVSRKMQLLK
ncbi:MAG: T9SS type A sorting domain-containing protein [Ignavibacteriaceae bacterium]|nr:T9SS type A sorting domain-containing protein [Ignavibacteriaceae bacterium]